MNNTINQSRISFEKLGEIYPPAENITIDKEVIEDIDCYWFRNKETINTGKIVIYLHGGCFVLGSIHSHQALVSHLANDLSLPFLFIEYGLAPEKPFPNGVNDVLTVYRHLLKQYPKDGIILMGDSAGAGLAVSLLSKIEAYRLPSPKFIVMLSPWIDLSCTYSSITENADKDPILKKERLLELVALYLGNEDLSNANPKEALIEKFPPTIILVGSNEILIDDSRFLYNKIIKDQPKTTLSIYENQSHVWLLDNVHTEQSQKAIKEIKAFLTD